MAACRACWNETDARLCPKCLTKIGELCTRAIHVREELETEKNKTAVKARQGGGGAKDTPPASLAALEADRKLTEAIKKLQADGKIRRDGKPETLALHLPKLRAPAAATADKDTVGVAVLNLEAAIIACEKLIDVAEDTRLMGRCSCGGLVKQYPGQVSIRCGGCRRLISVSEAKSRLQEEMSSHGQDSWLKDPEMCLFMAWEYGHDLKPATLRKWVSRGKISRDTRGRTHVPDVLDALESSALKVA